MNIKAQIHVNVDAFLKGATDTRLASGWVEIENAVKFPVTIRKYNDKMTGEEKMFVSYPQRKAKNGYTSVVYPHDPAVKEEINTCVLTEMRDKIVTLTNTMPITDVRIMMQPSEENSLPVVNRGFASVKFAGITINGIMIKQSKNGLFVQMPQHYNGKEYQDTVYGTNKLMQEELSRQVLSAFSKELEKEAAPEQKAAEQKKEMDRQEESVKDEAELQEQEKSTAEEILAAYTAGNQKEILNLLENAPLTVGQAEFTNNTNAVAFQEAVLEEGRYKVSVRFHNYWEPMQVVPPDKDIKQEIIAAVYRDNAVCGLATLTQAKSRSLKNTEKNYQDMLSRWKKMTHQNKISFDKEPEQEMTKIPSHPEPSIRSPRK